MDEMRYGLISNMRRSWSIKGGRIVIDHQINYSNSYLFSGVNPLSGESFHLIGFPDMNTDTINRFLLEIKKEYSNKHVFIVWDNAPTHRPIIHKIIEGLTLIQLPSYSPELNPAERFFEEIRKSTANKTFESLQEQEKIIEEEVLLWMKDKERMKKLIGFDWILEQCSKFK